MMVYNPDEVEKDYEEYNGGCWNCSKQFKLEEKETHCDNCGILTRWWCNGCKKPFDVEDKDTKEKLKECKLCGYFICPHCETCLSTCEKWEWQKEILNILKKDIPIGKYPSLPKRAKEITELVINKKISIERKICPERGVPISYAHGKIKSLLAKFEGFRVKNELDKEAFLKRIDEITNIEIGKGVTVTSARENGTYGQEYRDAFNLAVCLGQFKIEKRTREKSGNTYDIFIRCENGPCKFLARDVLIITYCEKCKKRFPKGTLVCDECIPYLKGKNKGKLRILKERLNSDDVCQCYRGLFNKI